MAKNKTPKIKWVKEGNRWVCKDERTPTEIALDNAKDENRKRREQAKADGTLTNRPNSGFHGPTKTAERRQKRREGKIRNPNDPHNRVNADD